MSTPRLRAGLIGLGRMGRRHARILRQLPGVDLVGVVDPVGDRYHAAEGVVHDLATHDLDLTAWLTGQHYTTIAARTAHCTTGPHEDLLAALGQLTDGTITHHQANRITPRTQRTIIITGQHGCLIADTLNTTLTCHANSPDAIHYPINKTEPLRTEHETFRDTVLGHHPPTAPLHDALHTVLIADAALQAAHTGTTITIANAPTDPPTNPPT